MPKKSAPRSPVTFECKYETDDPEIHLIEIGYTHASSGERRAMLVRPSLSNRPSELRDKLVDADASGVTPATMAAVTAVLAGEPKSQKKLTTVTGWCSVAARDYFVLGRETVGHTDPPVVHEDSRSPTPPSHRASGKFKRWRKAVTRAGRLSNYHLFTVAASLTGPLLRSFTPATGLVFNFSGHSGSGKTTLLQVAQSAFRRSIEEGDLPKLAITETALEELAASHNDLVLCIDEWGALVGDAAAASSIVLALSYRLRDGAGKARSRRGNASLGYNTNLSWRIVALTTSEEPLEHLTGRARYPGEQVRFIEIYVPGKEEGGVWDRTAVDLAAAHERTAKLQDALRENYGLALPRFASQLAADPSRYSRMANEAMGRFVARVLAEGTIANEQRRHAEAFGKVYAAAVVAHSMKLLPFTEDEAMRAVLAMHAKSELAREATSGRLNEACRKLLDLADDPDRCVPASARIDGRGGQVIAITKTLDKRPALAVLSDRFDEVCAPLKAKPLIEQLKEAGILLPETKKADGRRGNDRRQVNAEGLVPDVHRPRFYVFAIDELRRGIGDR